MEQVGPMRAALHRSWPQLADEAKYVREAILLDRAGCETADVKRGMSALESAYNVRDEWLYFRTVVLESMSRRWPDVMACTK